MTDKRQLHCNCSRKQNLSFNLNLCQQVESLNPQPARLLAAAIQVENSVQVACLHVTLPCEVYCSCRAWGLQKCFAWPAGENWPARDLPGMKVKFDSLCHSSCCRNHRSCNKLTRLIVAAAYHLIDPARVQPNIADAGEF